MNPTHHTAPCAIAARELWYLRRVAYAASAGLDISKMRHDQKLGGRGGVR